MHLCFSPHVLLYCYLRLAPTPVVPCERCIPAGRTGAAQKKRRAAHYACAMCAYEDVRHVLT